MTGQLEHTNFTVTDPDATAAWMCRVFGWHVRWSGPSKDEGRSVHVGSDDAYLALYAPASQTRAGPSSYVTTGGLNHVGVVVDDIEAAEKRVQAEGFTPHNHADYEPGRRFYFHDTDGIEFEIVQYDAA